MKKGILSQLLLPIPIVTGIAIIGAAALVPPLIASDAVAIATEQARHTVDQFKTLRAYYTKFIVGKVTSGGTMKAVIDHQNDANGIPLPATMIMDLSGLLEKQGTSLKLYSPYPFSNRADRKLDDFGTAAWNFLQQNPDSVFSRRDTLGGREVVRVAVADRMVDPSCVACHNSFPGSPKTDWKLGDLRGVLEVDEDVSGALARGTNLTHLILLGAVLIGGVLALVAALVARRISMPIKSMTTAMERLAEGKSDTAIPALNGKDEVGTMARTVVVFKDNMIAAKKLEAQRQEEEARKEARQTRIAGLIASFEGKIGKMVAALSSAASEMKSTSQSLSSMAGDTSERSTTVAAAAEQAAANVQTVATATEELSASVSEISRQVANSAKVASKAVDDAKRTDATVQSLAMGAQKIGEVITLIQQIASQTNLLALNATIEAARAGEAGKGFAVVASEVKSLANQTAKATEEIASQVEQIRSSTGQAVDAIREIGAVIEEINGIASTIAAAVQQQGSATQEIARNVQEVASGTQEVTRNMASVKDSSAASGAASSQVLTSASGLAEQAETLRHEVDRFLGDIRAA